MKRKKTERILISLLSIFIILTIFPAIGNSAIPQTINYQGYLTDSVGVPIDGTVQMTFSIYDVVTGGAVLWNETQTVTLSDGIYNVNLGEVNPVNLSFDTQYYLGVTVGTDAEMTPRQPFTSVPYAMNADRAEMAIDINDNAVTTSKISAGAVTSGKIANNAVGTAEIIDSSVASTDVGFNYAGSASKGGPADNLTCIGCVSQSELDFTAGDITAVNPGAGLTGGGATGNVTLGVDTTAIQNRVAGLCPAGNSIRVINEDGTVDCEATGTQTGLWIDPNNYNSINAAVADASGRTVIIYNIQTLAGNLTVPADVGLFVIPGGKIAKASTYTLTINGSFQAGQAQAFSGFNAGDVTFGDNAVDKVHPAWWGAAVNSSTDDQIPLQSAVSSFYRGGTVQLPQGRMYVSSSIVVPRNVIIQGYGRGSIIWSDQGNFSVFTTSAVYNDKVTFRDFYIQATTGAAVGSSAVGKGIAINPTIPNQTPFVSIERMQIQGFDVGIELINAWSSNINDTYVIDSNSYGIYINAGSHATTLINVNVDYVVGTGLIISDTASPVAEETQTISIIGGAYQNAAIGIHAKSSRNTRLYNVYFEGNTTSDVKLGDAGVPYVGGSYGIYGMYSTSNCSEANIVIESVWGGVDMNGISFYPGANGTHLKVDSFSNGIFFNYTRLENTTTPFHFTGGATGRVLVSNNGQLILPQTYNAMLKWGTYTAGVAGAVTPAVEIELQTPSDGWRIKGLTHNIVVEIPDETYKFFVNNASNDQLLIIDNDSTAGNTRMQVWDVDSNQIMRVSVGSANSCGTGYKCLRIPNLPN